MREASVPLPGPSLSTSPLPSGRDASSSVFLGRPNQVKGRGQNVGSEPWAQSLLLLPYTVAGWQYGKLEQNRKGPIPRVLGEKKGTGLLC